MTPSEDEDIARLMRIGPICERFDQAWRSPTPPDITVYFAEGLEQDRRSLLDELLRVEIWYRRKRNESPSASEYRGKFPGCEDVVEDAFNRTERSSITQFDQTIDHSSSQSNSPSGPDFVPPPGKGFAIERCLGRGAYGSVWLVRDTTLERPVAVKAPRRDKQHSERILKLFAEEARKSASLDHTNIVRIYEQGAQPDGMPYVVMHYVDGSSLQETIRSKSLTPRDAVELLAQVADGLAHAHSKHIIHRDLKPANILVSKKGVPYIADFGMAMHDRERSERIGERVGTRSYMAPEQIDGTSLTTDHRCDIWAMGVIMYEMLVGEMPFDGDNEEQLFRAIREHVPTSLTVIDPSLLPEWGRICSKCLEKDPGKRYENAAELASDLRRSLRSRRKIWIVAAASVVFALVGVPAGFAYYRGDDPADGQQAPLKAIDGTIDVRIWEKGNNSRRGLGIRQQGALPLKPKDQIRVEARLNRPAYVYVVWIDIDGKATPIYPWKPGDWQSFPENEVRTDQISLPDGVDNAWPLAGGPGMETLLLLARDEPLPRSTNMEQLFANLPRQGMRHSQLCVDFRDGAMVVTSDPATGETRGPQVDVTEQIDDSVLQTQGRLQREFKELFQLFKAVSFANGGK